MSFNQFTNLDFSDLRTQIKDYLRANQNFTENADETKFLHAKSLM